MSFKKITGDSLVKSVKDGNFRELKNDLDEEIVEETKKVYRKFGGKLSPLINELLSKWCEENKD